MNHTNFRRFLWMAALTVPIPAGAYAVHTPDSILTAAGIFFLLSLLVPCWILSRGGETGKIMAAAHPVCAVCLNLLMDFFVFLWLLSEEKLSAGTNVLLQGVFGLLGFTAALAAMLLADRIGCFLYRRIGAMWPKQVTWIVFAFYSGAIPGTILATIGILALFSADHGYAAFFFLISGMVIMLYLKIALAMAAVALYLFLGTSGNKWKRLTRAAFTGFFWLALVYACLVAAQTSDGAWQAVSYLVIFPYFSDLWLAFVSLYLGTRVTEWIWRD